MKKYPIALTALASSLVPSLAQAYLAGPYTVDANTMHLWHLDEATGPAVDQAHYNYAGTFTTKPDANQPLNALYGTGSLNNTSATGFGTAYSGGATPANAGLGALAPNNGTADNADHTFDHPTTHAFTFEAVIKIGFNPLTNYAAPQEIIAGEGDAGDSSDRSWQFRIEANTNAAVNPWQLRFQKLSGFGGAGGSTGNFALTLNIPTAGANALAQDSFYHVAVTFNGDWATAGNMQLYWTKLDEANTAASSIGSGQLNGWLRQQDTDFAIGNEQRDFNGNTEGFRGLIDEVRISDIARSSTDMMFTAIPEPSTFALGVAGMALVAALGRRRRA